MTPTEIARLLTKKSLSRDEIRLHMGELTAQGMRDVEAAIQWQSAQYIPAIRHLLQDIAKLRKALSQSKDFAAHVLAAGTVEISPKLEPWIDKWAKALSATEGYVELLKEPRDV